MATYDERVKAEEDKHFRHSEEKNTKHCTNCGLTFDAVHPVCPQCGSFITYETR